MFGAGWGWVRSGEERQAVQFGEEDEGHRMDYEERQETRQVLFRGCGESQRSTRELTTSLKWQQPSPWCQRTRLTSSIKYKSLSFNEIWGKTYNWVKNLNTPLWVFLFVCFLVLWNKTIVGVIIYYDEIHPEMEIRDGIVSGLYDLNLFKFWLLFHGDNGWH